MWWSVADGKFAGDAALAVGAGKGATGAGGFGHQFANTQYGKWEGADGCVESRARFREAVDQGAGFDVGGAEFPI